MSSRRGLGLAFYWKPAEALVAAFIASLGLTPVYFTHPNLHWAAYALGWIVLAAVVYQTGCELSERNRTRSQ